MSKSTERLLHVIVNPASGNGRAGRRWPEFAAKISAKGFDCEVTFTQAPGEAQQIARDYAQAGARYIVAIGGDGTANEIINGLLDDDEPVNPETRLALIPCGTGKDLSRSLGTPKIEHTLRAIELDATTQIDVARISYTDADTMGQVERYFANVADLGLGADVARRSNTNGKAYGATIPYLINVFKSVATFRGCHVDVEADDEHVYSGEALMVVFANGRFHAGGMRLAPQASLRDGLLDIYVLEQVNRGALLTSLLPRVYIGAHGSHKNVRHIRAKQVEVKTAAPLLIEMDGEQLGQGPVSVRVIPRVLRVIGAGSVLR